MRLRLFSSSGLALLIVLSLSAGICGPGFASASKARPELLSRADGAAGAKGDADSGDPSVSADGRLVAFQSKAANLAPDDADGIQDVFVRDRVAQTTTLVSRAGGLLGPKGNSDSADPAISPDGRFVAFVSRADNLVPGVGGTDHVFVRDLIGGTTTVVDRATGPAGAVGDAAASEPAISPGGLKVAFSSHATNLYEGATGTKLVYVRDLQTGETEVVSRGPGADGAPANMSSGAPSISADGTRLAFATVASNLGAPVNPNYGAAFVRDLAAGTTDLVSRQSGPDGKPSRIGAQLPSISADGRRVAFITSGQNLHPRDRLYWADVYVRDLDTEKTIYASRQLGRLGRARPARAEYPTLSANGTKVAFELEYEGPGKLVRRVVVRNLRKKRTKLVRGVTTDHLPKRSLRPMIAADGRSVVFQSDFDELTPEDRDRTLDVFEASVSGR